MHTNIGEKNMLHVHFSESKKYQLQIKRIGRQIVIDFVDNSKKIPDELKILVNIVTNILNCANTLENFILKLSPNIHDIHDRHNKKYIKYKIKYFEYKDQLSNNNNIL